MLCPTSFSLKAIEKKIDESAERKQCVFEGEGVAVCGGCVLMCVVCRQCIDVCGV